MSADRDTCRYPTCDREPGTADDNPAAYRTSRFCSLEHAVKYDHIKADARDARRADRRQAEEGRR